MTFPQLTTGFISSTAGGIASTGAISQSTTGQSASQTSTTADEVQSANSSDTNNRDSFTTIAIIIGAGLVFLVFLISVSN